MKSKSPRQLSLYFAACLYQLASEFDSDELAVILEEHRSHGHSKPIISAIRALQELHANDVGLKIPHFESRDLVRVVEGKDFDSRNSRLSESLVDVFSDKRQFPTVSSISEVTRFGNKPKEARDRYMARLQRHVASLSSEERQKFFKMVSQRATKSTGNFVSKWSDLIQST
jgi:hypothetical protein